VNGFSEGLSNQPEQAINQSRQLTRAAMNNLKECQRRAGITSILAAPKESVTPSPYTGPATDPQVEGLTHRGYNRRRSRIVDRWLAYADAEGFTGGGGQGVGA
jgi:hypothetical protein